MTDIVDVINDLATRLTALRASPNPGEARTMIAWLNAGTFAKLAPPLMEFLRREERKVPARAEGAALPLPSEEIVIEAKKAPTLVRFTSVSAELLQLLFDVSGGSFNKAARLYSGYIDDTVTVGTIKANLAKVLKVKPSSVVLRTISNVDIKDNEYIAAVARTPAGRLILINLHSDGYTALQKYMAAKPVVKGLSKPVLPTAGELQLLADARTFEVQREYELGFSQRFQLANLFDPIKKMVQARTQYDQLQTRKLASTNATERVALQAAINAIEAVYTIA
ncbi:Hypothetical protein POVN_LOCUS364 [uncultured virus]|nr:Hypothetical protein POVN_LOCUS364 [uncultured virus]